MTTDDGFKIWNLCHKYMILWQVVWVGDSILYIHVLSEIKNWRYWVKYIRSGVIIKIETLILVTWSDKF